MKSEYIFSSEHYTFLKEDAENGRFWISAESKLAVRPFMYREAGYNRYYIQIQHAAINTNLKGAAKNIELIQESIDFAKRVIDYLTENNYDILEIL